MNELIDALRCESVINDEHPRCESCKYGVVVCHGSREDVYGCNSRRIENDAADAIERMTEKTEHLQRAYNAVHDDYNMECFAFKFGYLDSAIRDALGIKGESNEQQP